ncbi:hypothetical protein [Streptomyces sp. NPDC048277]|uniref:hypothetical protein n=1 Tax=Streptomyces sp. NPDC048277 TaxID=3155027 RepID=UPI0033ED59DE
MSQLIDTTEMYLRTVLELEEEDAVPLPARMERDGLLYVAGDRLSEAVERRILQLLRHPTQSPYGEESDESDESTVSLSALRPGPHGASAVVRRIGEPIQTDPQLMYTRHARVQPGAVVSVTSSPGGGTVGSGGRAAELPTQTAAHIFVAKH